MSRMIPITVLAALCALPLCGCNLQETKWDAEVASQLVYAKSIPVYPGSKSDGVSGSESWGDEPDSYSEGRAAWFTVEGFEKGKVVSWYQSRLQNAETELLDDGAVQITVPAPNGEPGEDMGVVVDNESYRIFEHTKAGKHRGI